MPRLIDPSSDRPIYRQIADHLRADIRGGRYPDGAPLPSESRLAEMYDVIRMTARQAVDVLKNEGLIRSEHGRGVFVRQRPRCTGWPAIASPANGVRPVRAPTTWR
jgi:GntR family transcriptional regulator